METSNYNAPSMSHFFHPFAIKKTSNMIVSLRFFKNIAYHQFSKSDFNRSLYMLQTKPQSKHLTTSHNSYNKHTSGSHINSRTPQRSFMNRKLVTRKTQHKYKIIATRKLPISWKLIMVEVVVERYYSLFFVKISIIYHNVQ